MMRRWRKPKRTHIVLYRADGTVLAQHLLHSFPLPEATIIALSIQYFDDSEPCHIHRSAVLARAMEELASLCAEGETVRIDTLPTQQRAYFAEGEADAFAIGVEV